MNDNTELDSAIGKIAFCIAGARGAREGGHYLSPGDVSSLRRMDISVPCAAFWRLMSDFVPEHRRSGRDKETRWALVCKAMAVMAPNVHDGAISPGQGLNRTGFSSDDRPIRINRLLRAEGSAFEDLFLSASAFLAAKAQPVDWRKFAKLALNQDEKARNSLARDFFTNPRRAEAA